MDSAWTPERKTKQAAAIQNWKPWQKSTGPMSLQGKTNVSRNAFKGGKRAKFRADIRMLKLVLTHQKQYLDDHFTR